MNAERQAAPTPITAADRECFIANVRDLLGSSTDFESAVRSGASDCAPGLIAIAGHRAALPALPTDAQVRDAMQTAWDDYCDDAQAFPGDLTKLSRGRILFNAGTWADHTAMQLRAILATAAGPQPIQTTPVEGKCHHIKCWPDVFEEMRAGRKTAEFRYNDRGYQVGDTLLIREWDTGSGLYTHREITRRITHVLDDGFGMPSGYAMLSLSDYQAQPPQYQGAIDWAGPLIDSNGKPVHVTMTPEEQHLPTWAGHYDVRVGDTDEHRTVRADTGFTPDGDYSVSNAPAGSCLLCAGKCRSHGLGDPAAWEPEAGSAAALARAKHAV